MTADEVNLRPLERAVRKCADEGMPATEIAWRFRRSPGHIQRVLDLSEVPRQGRPGDATDSEGLRPVERCVVKAREAGSDYPEIAARLKRSPEFVARVERWANFKRGGRRGGL